MTARPSPPAPERPFPTAAQAAEGGEGRPAPLQRLPAVLAGLPGPAVAVSGGVDSLTLAAAAHDVLGARTRVVHAVSPAVPPEATMRVRVLAARRGWRLDVVDAGEFADPRYLANPANRCFFCKTNLYATLRRIAGPDGPVASGTNLDDLDDWRPGLQAAAEHGVVHPFVEAGLAKADVRRLARDLGLGTIADLPAQPCLSSRIETGIPVTAADLALVHAVETEVAAALAPQAVRARLFRRGLVVQLDADALARADDRLARRVAAVAARHGRPGTPAFEAYARGSAFRRGGTA